MTSRLEELRRRFEGTAESRRRRRRKDYLGNRGRLNLRVSEEVARGLEILKVASGVDKNGFCERVIGAAVTEQLEALRLKLGEEKWEAIVRSAGRRERGDN